MGGDRAAYLSVLGESLSHVHAGAEQRPPECLEHGPADGIIRDADTDRLAVDGLALHEVNHLGGQVLGGRQDQRVLQAGRQAI